MKDMVGPNGLEPSTFPASRDALTEALAVDKFLNRPMRFPTFQLPLAATSLSQGLILFLIHQLPRSTTSGVRALPSFVFCKAGRNIKSGTNVEFLGGLTLQNVKKRHVLYNSESRPHVGA